MTAAYGRVKGLATLVKAVRVICRIVLTFGPYLRPKLSAEAKTAYDALTLACDAFLATLPEPGADNDPASPS